MATFVIWWLTHIHQNSIVNLFHVRINNVHYLIISKNCLWLWQINSTFLTTLTISVDFPHSSVTFRNPAFLQFSFQFSEAGENFLIFIWILKGLETPLSMITQETAQNQDYWSNVSDTNSGSLGCHQVKNTRGNRNQWMRVHNKDIPSFPSPFL